MVYRRSARRAPRRYTRRPSYRAPARARPARRRTYTKRATSRRAPKKECVCPGELNPGNKFIMAQLDPFDQIVTGAKIPDSNTMPSIANSDVDIVNLASTAVSTDLSALAFRPQYTWGTVVSTGGAAAVWAPLWGGGTNRAKRAPYIAAMELTRPVAHAIRISSPLAPTSASGFCHIGLSYETQLGETTWTYPTTIATISGLQHYKRVTIASLTQSPLTVINKWLDDSAFRYSSPSSTMVENATSSSFQTDGSWAVIVIMIEGAPTSSTVLSVEHLLLSEGLPRKDGVIIGTLAAANNPQVLQAVGEMSTAQEPFHTEAEQDSYIQRGVNAVAQGAAAHGERMFNTVAVPLLQRAGQYGVGVAVNMAAMAMSGRGGISGVNSNANRLTL